MAKKTKDWTVQVSDKNKRELERIKRELESFHEKNFGLDVAIGHVLRIYKDIMKVMKNKEDQTKYLKYLQKL